MYENRFLDVEFPYDHAYYAYLLYLLCKLF